MATDALVKPRQAEDGKVEVWISAQDVCALDNVRELAQSTQLLLEALGLPNHQRPAAALVQDLMLLASFRRKVLRRCLPKTLTPQPHTRLQISRGMLLALQNLGFCLVRDEDGRPFCENNYLRRAREWITGVSKPGSDLSSGPFRDTLPPSRWRWIHRALGTGTISDTSRELYSEVLRHFTLLHSGKLPPHGAPLQPFPGNNEEVLKALEKLRSATYFVAESFNVQKFVKRLSELRDLLRSECEEWLLTDAGASRFRQANQCPSSRVKADVNELCFKAVKDHARLFSQRLIELVANVLCSQLPPLLSTQKLDYFLSYFLWLVKQNEEFHDFSKLRLLWWRGSNTGYYRLASNVQEAFDASQLAQQNALNVFQHAGSTMATLLKKNALSGKSSGSTGEVLTLGLPLHALSYQKADIEVALTALTHKYSHFEVSGQMLGKDVLSQHTHYVSSETVHATELNQAYNDAHRILSSMPSHVLREEEFGRLQDMSQENLENLESCRVFNKMISDKNIEQLILTLRDATEPVPAVDFTVFSTPPVIHESHLENFFKRPSNSEELGSALETIAKGLAEIVLELHPSDRRGLKRHINLVFLETDQQSQISETFVTYTLSLERPDITEAILWLICNNRVPCFSSDIKQIFLHGFYRNLETRQKIPDPPTIIRLWWR